MAKAKQNNNEESEPLSNFQDVAKTGRSGGPVVISGTADEIKTKLERALKKTKGGAADDKEIDITAASLAGEFCNYSYEILEGKCAGDSVSRQGSNIFHDDLKKAFWKLFVHLAIICEEIDANKVSNIEALQDIDFDKLYDENGNPVYKKGTIEDRVTHFRVGSFTLKGTGENASIVLIGTKALSTGELVKLTTPAKKWQGDYAFINELRVVVDDLKIEVEEYMGGKCAPKLIQQEMFPEDELAEENV